MFHFLNQKCQKKKKNPFCFPFVSTGKNTLFEEINDEKKNAKKMTKETLGGLLR